MYVCLFVCVCLFVIDELINQINTQQNKFM